MECGKTIPVSAAKVEKEDRRTESANSKSKRKRTRKQNEKRATAETHDPQAYQDGYDGYYNDVIPADNGVGHEKLDKNLVKRIILVGVVALAIVVLAFILMQLI